MTHSWEDVIIMYDDYDIYDDDYDDDNEVTLAETHFGAYHRPPDGQF